MADGSKRMEVLLAIEATEGQWFTSRQIRDALQGEVSRPTINNVINELIKGEALHVTGEGVGVQYMLPGREGLEPYLAGRPKNNKKEAVPVTVNETTAANGKPSTIDFSTLTMKETEELLEWFVKDYLRCKQDLHDMKGMLNRVFGQQLVGMPLGKRGNVERD